jgi:hypothetical protein
LFVNGQVTCPQAAHPSQPVLLDVIAPRWLAETQQTPACAHLSRMCLPASLRNCLLGDLLACLQVPVIQLLGHVWTTLLDTDSSSVAAVPAAAAAVGGGGGSSGAAAAAGGRVGDELPAAALPGMLAYLSGECDTVRGCVSERDAVCVREQYV